MRKEMISLTLVAILVLMSGLLGCEKRRPVATTQPQSVQTDRVHPMTRQFDQMSENADLTDMVVSDIHFVPHRAALNGTGRSRLRRLALLVNQYGGTIHVDLDQGGTELAGKRVKVVKKYMVACGVAKGAIVVKPGLSSTKGMPAGEAIIIYVDTRSKPADKKKGLLK